MQLSTNSFARIFLHHCGPQWIYCGQIACDSHVNIFGAWACCWIWSCIRHACSVITSSNCFFFFDPIVSLTAACCRELISVWTYQGRLLGLWGAGRAVRGGWTALVTGIGHVPICQGLKRRQSVLIHRDAVQGLCKHCQQVGLIFFIYLLRRGEMGEKTEAEKQRERRKKWQILVRRSCISLLLSSRNAKGCGWLHADFHS